MTARPRIGTLKITALVSYLNFPTELASATPLYVTFAKLPTSGSFVDTITCSPRGRSSGSSGPTIASSSLPLSVSNPFTTSFEASSVVTPMRRTPLPANVTLFVCAAEPMVKVPGMKAPVS